MDDVESLVNRISDMDAEWWPFLFLRPDREAFIGDGRVLALSVLYGGFVGMLANAAIALSRADNRPSVLVIPAMATITLFIVLRFSVALFWNRRAARLRTPRRLQAKLGGGNAGE